MNTHILEETDERKISISVRLAPYLIELLDDIAKVAYSDRSKIMNVILKDGIKGFLSREKEIDKKLSDYRASRSPKKRAV